MGTITTATRPAVLLRPSLPTINVNQHWAAALADVRASLLGWFDQNLKAEYGYEIDGNEIYWLSSIGPSNGSVMAGHDPALAVALRHGSSEGWILSISANLKLFQGGAAYLPIYQAKVWTVEAGCLLGAAVMAAAVDAFQPAG
jgi:hypothetical protein